MSEREPFDSSPGEDEGRPHAGQHPHDGTLWSFVADALNAQEADAVAEHLTDCDACTEAIAAFGEVADTLHAVHEAPADLARVRGRRRLAAALQEEVVVARRRAVKGPRMLLVAAVAAFAGAAVATVATVDPVRAWLGGRDAPAAQPMERDRAALDRAAPAPAPVRPRVDVQAQQAADPVQPAPEPAAEQPIPPAPSDAERQPVASAAAPTPSARTVMEAPAPAVEPAVEAAAPVDIGPRVARADGTPSPQEAYEAAASEMADKAEGDPGWLGVGDLGAMAGNVNAAASAYTEALKGARGKVAGERLEKLVQTGALKPGAAMALVKKQGGDGAEALRVLCAWGLRHRGDRPAVAVCQAFGRQFPQHPSARSLALSAGRTAEFKLKDLALAEEEYSRAILVSQYAGVPGTSALLARARCRMKQKNLDEARADLRLFLHVQPEARWREDVNTLAEQLEMSLPAPPAEQP